MKLQLIGNDGKLMTEKEISVNILDTVFMTYDSHNGLEATVVKNDLNVKEEFVPKTNQFKVIKKHLEATTQRFAQEYMHKYEKADTDLSVYKEQISKR